MKVHLDNKKTYNLKQLNIDPSWKLAIKAEFGNKKIILFVFH